MITNKMIAYFFVLALSAFHLSSSISYSQDAKYKMEGRVVKFGGNCGIDNVEVRVKYSMEGNVEIDPPPKTKSGGNYVFEVPIKQDKVWIEYIPEDTTKLDPAGRSAVKNSANPKDLDTIGLVSNIQACENAAAARVAAWNTVEFIRAGGERALAVKFPQALQKEKDNCSLAFEAVRQDKELVRSLDELKLIDWLQ